MPPQDITQLLLSLRQGHRDALNDLFPLVYQQMRAMARSRLSTQGPTRP